MDNFVQRTIENTKRDHKERLGISLLSYALLAIFFVALFAGAREVASVTAILSILVWLLLYRR